MATNSGSTVEQTSPWRPRVFLSFRGADLRYGFISFLERELTNNKIEYYIDTAEIRGKSVDVILERIELYDIALVFFSEQYANSEFCLDELVKIVEYVKMDQLVVIPIFFRVNTDDVQELKHNYGNMLWDIYRDNLDRNKLDRKKFDIWMDALKFAPTRMGLVLKEESSECDLLVKIIKSIEQVEVDILTRRGRELSNSLTCSGSSSSLTTDQQVRPSPPPPPPYGMEQRLKQLEERLDFSSPITQVVGIVGMSGIGKTTLAQMHYETYKKEYIFRKIVLGIREIKPKNDEFWLRTELLAGTKYNEASMFKMKMFVVLDDVSEMDQIKYLLDNLGQIKKGSKIVITARDKSWIEALGHDTYVVPGLSEKDALQLFHFKNQNSTPVKNFIELSKKFVDYAEGNPRALNILGEELCGQDEPHWRKQPQKLPPSFRDKIREAFRISYDELTDGLKDAFLDIACFFRSEDKDCVTSLLDSKDPVKDVRYLTDKFMISVSAGHIEMSNLMCSMGKDLGLLTSAQDKLETRRLWNKKEVIDALLNSDKEDCTVRGILLDVSKLETEISIASYKLTLMPNLQYLKIFDSHCPRQCKVVKDVACKVKLPDELEFPHKKIRYFHWLKFPLTQLPSDFNPENLIDLRLPYSKIESIWEVVKDTPNLKRVDLRHSEMLIDLSALSNAKSLQTLNLEGCIKLVKLPEDTKSLHSLTFLNLRGCRSLSFLPETMNLESLKTLILSDCSNFKRFKVISESLEHLHLDGTIIETLPPTIQALQNLVVLNLKDCEMLECLPDCLEKLRALEELILSGCSRLQEFPEIKEKMEKMQVLLLDRTSIKEVPTTSRGANSKGEVNLQRLPQMSGLFLLRRLCLSRNEEISSLQSNICELHHLKWIDLKYCSNLISISTLPPNLQCLDAHACTSLKSVASPLANPIATEQVPSSFIFTNCEKLEHAAKTEITWYGYRKGLLLAKTLNRHKKGLSYEALVATCFPGSEVPAWFDHKGYGEKLEPELPKHWTESGFVGIALCAIVSFKEQNIQNNILQVKCKCDFNNVETSSSYFNCPVGGLSEMGNEQRTIKSTHVFIGYTNWLNIKKCQEEDGKKGCVPTKASIRFQVTDDIGEVTNCEVLKCGFSLVYESGSWGESSSNYDVEQSEVESLEMSQKFSKMIDANGGATTRRDNIANGEANCSS